MKLISLLLRSVSEVKWPRRITLRITIPKTISIWLSHDVCLGRYTKRMRWLLSARNFRRVSCDSSTPALPFFSQLLVEVASFGHCLHQTFRGVDIQVVHDEHPRGRGFRRHRLDHVLHKVLLCPRRTDRWRDQPPAHYLEVADVRQRPVPLIFKLATLGLAWLHRQSRGDAFQRLDAGHFVDAHRTRVLLGEQTWRVPVTVTYFLDLLLKLDRILLFRVQPVPALVRLQFGFVQIAPHLRCRDRFHDLAFFGLIDQFGDRPMRDRPARHFRRLARQGQEQGDLLWRKLTGVAAPRLIAQGLLDGPSKLSPCFHALDQNQSTPALGPTSTPFADVGGVHADLPSNVGVIDPIKRPQDNGGTLHQVLGAGPALGDLSENVLLPFRHSDLRRRSRHGRPPCLVPKWTNKEILPRLAASWKSS